MANTEVLLLKPVDGLGAEGDQVKVRAGFARNYLLPQHFALPVNRANRKQIESLKKRRAEREAKELEGAQALAAKLANVRVAFAVKTGEGGKMFGSVSVTEIHARLAAEGVELDRRKIHLPTPVKALGKHSLHFKLHSQVQLDWEFEVVSENPIEEPKKDEEADKKAEETERKPRPKREKKAQS